MWLDWMAGYVIIEALDVEFAKYPAQQTCPALDVRRQVGNLEKVLSLISWPGREYHLETFVFDFGKGWEDHLGSHPLCILDYQAQIGVTVKNVFWVSTMSSMLPIQR